ncbi:LON peptidase N-terminal domain and RING finger protein 1 [Uranotaenia lowii]|uniref:LON peptidase N-terminal domain and RING finger protein 1 n=1 Tax=Uranotaenia lowii TaxID=190385 RepID=UPI00247B23DC|nr:LON peptidase N-terminal domain and RING finger protein 1 [Uranotaenia lowii]XP_055603198.1 LON peptidase N-terminal domain and RING finger protein 1 [Uranotaenia lowii]XP_055603199.1 LON peptidase N-terminal domain and RING finger protein 1 [Uranotaenia lowii]
MAAMTDAFMGRDYLLACKSFRKFLRENYGSPRVGTSEIVSEMSAATGSAASPRQLPTSVYYNYGDSLAKSGRLKEALDVYGHISQLLGSNLIPLEKLSQLSQSLINYSKRTNDTAISLNKLCYDNGSTTVDPLSCPVCEGVLRFPVTATCGHTFCRQCCFGHTKCPVCSQQFPTVASRTATVTSDSLATLVQSEESVDIDQTAGCSSTGETSVSISSSSVAGSSGNGAGDEGSGSVIGFEQDILVRRLVERWWGPELKAAEYNEEAQRFLECGALDDALRCCNQSLEYAPNSSKGLLLRSEVLYRLQHYQSSLADADNALKSRPTYHKAHYCRAQSLSALGKSEQAIIARCLSLFLDKQSQCVANGIEEEIAKDLQKLLASIHPAQEVRSIPPPRPLIEDPLAEIFGAPFPLMNNRKRRHHRILSAHKHKAKKQFLSLRTSDFDEDHSDCGDEEYFLRASLFEDLDEEFYQQTINPPHHRRKSLTAYNFNIFGSETTSGATERSGTLASKKSPIVPPVSLIIPRPNSRLRSFVDRMTNELDSIRWAEGSPVRLNVNPLAIEVSDFDCVLCCRTLWKPVVTPCGHTYCWICLDRCMDYSSSCPLCMAPLIEQFRHHLASSGALNGAANGSGGNIPATNLTLLATNPTLISLSKRKVTQFVEEAMQRFIPDAYEKRQRQELDREPTVPVFICTTAFPSVPCPLFVYEPRYRLMVRRAIESGERQFGIALPQQNGRQRYVEYGTMLDIRDCVQLGDGCSILSTVGGRRFRVVARYEKDGYDTANVEFIEDDRIDGSLQGLEGATAGDDEKMHLIRELHEKVLLKAIGWHQSLPENIKCEIFKSFGKMPDLEDNWEDEVDGPAWAWWIIAILPLSQHLKVGILSTTSLEKRLRAIDKTLNLESAQRKRKRSVCIVPSSPASPPPAGCCDELQGPDVVVVQHQSQHHQHHHHDHQQQHQEQHHHHHHHHHHDHHSQQQHQHQEHDQQQQQPQCQAIDCCLRERTTSTVHHHHNHHHHHHLSQSTETADYLL